MTPVRLEPVALRSRVKHSTTEPLRSLRFVLDVISIKGETILYIRGRFGEYTKMENTLNKISNWSPYFFYVSFESKI